ncbi:MAG: hybrid sensor histidine kinase/response regulator [Desulfomonilaceae bacterium]|nr:hybrid sensor histidine kinase/response regulator [Desulfomonilaceae bacterium]
MPKSDEEFLKKLFAAFRVEAEEHLRAIGNGLLEVEKGSGGDDEKELIETMYREAHSLKGAARSVGMMEIEAVCQGVESVFAKLKSGVVKGSTELFDTLHRATDIMTGLLAGAQGVEMEAIVGELRRFERSRAEEEEAGLRGGPEASFHGESETAEAPDCEEPVHPPNDAVRQTFGPATEPAVQVRTESQGETLRRERTSHWDTIRISVSKLDPLLRRMGEMISVKLTAGQRVTDLMALLNSIDEWKQKWAAFSSDGKSLGRMVLTEDREKVSSETSRNLEKIEEFVEWNERWIKTMEAEMREVAKAAEADARLHGTMVDDLLDDMMSVLMLPCSTILEIFPKLVRDLSRDSGKDANLVIRGGDLEVDRRILEEMKDPLIHLLRNSIDHGIEGPDERERAGKPRQGTVTIAISQMSGKQLEMIVSDDGAGIDTTQVREAATRQGLLTEQEKYAADRQDALSLMFRSEVSTSPMVTSISGRGLGLAIVREKVETLGGNISVSTEAHFGTTFRIVLPITLSTFRGILVKAHDRQFVLPTANVERVSRIKKEMVKTVGNTDTIEMNDYVVPLVRLGEILEIPRPEKGNGDSQYIPVLLLRSGETLVSFSVDDILQEQEVLVKGLGSQLSRVRNVAGATVLGSGKLVPILSVSDLIKSAVRRSFETTTRRVEAQALIEKTKSILVVEDSITSRMLLKNILESSGYDVTTSVDGAEAYSALRTQDFDLVVSDIEMPRMDGFELTSAIRADEHLNHLPVVLVTSLGSREDKERGIDVGANAYIVKGSFDQNNLLETVARLI